MSIEVAPKPMAHYSSQEIVVLTEKVVSQLGEAFTSQDWVRVGDLTQKLSELTEALKPKVRELVDVEQKHN